MQKILLFSCSRSLYMRLLWNEIVLWDSSIVERGKQSCFNWFSCRLWKEHLNLFYVRIYITIPCNLFLHFAYIMLNPKYSLESCTLLRISWLDWSENNKQINIQTSNEERKEGRKNKWKKYLREFPWHFYIPNSTICSPFRDITRNIC